MASFVYTVKWCIHAVVGRTYDDIRRHAVEHCQVLFSLDTGGGDIPKTSEITFIIGLIFVYIYPYGVF